MRNGQNNKRMWGRNRNHKFITVVVGAAVAVAIITIR